MVVSINNAALNNLQQILVSNVEVDGELLNLSTSELKQVRISNVENKHESAVITTQLTKAQIDKFIGKTITFDYGPRVSGRTFYGYVIVINPNQDYQQDAIVDITCFGTTWPLQSGEPRFFVNRTAPSVFAEIVTAHNLGCQVDDHPYVWPVLSQTEESDWEFLQTLATRIGYSIYLYNGIIRLVNPVRVVSETGAYQRFIKSGDVLDPSRQLLDFNPITQSLNIRDNMKPSFGYFDGTVATLTAPKGTYPYRMSTSTPIRDRDMGKVYSEAWERRVDFWNQQAVLRINGNAGLVPGINVAVQVSGNPSGKNDYDGVWFVRGVEHSLTNNSFQSAITVARDNNTPRKVNPDFRWFFTNTKQGNPTVRKVETGSPVSKKWESNWKKPETVTPILTDLVPLPKIEIIGPFVGP
jgi:uncharacterized protein involved in type VI secretion and phage assembly